MIITSDSAVPQKGKARLSVRVITTKYGCRKGWARTRTLNKTGLRKEQQTWLRGHVPLLPIWHQGGRKGSAACISQNFETLGLSATDLAVKDVTSLNVFIRLKENRIPKYFRNHFDQEINYMSKPCKKLQQWKICEHGVLYVRGCSSKEW
jgi:hypothetical protein